MPYIVTTDSKNVLGFKYYNPEEVVAGKKMKDHLRFSVCFWHTFRGTGADPFGFPTLIRPWDDGSNSMANAKRRVRASFEFFQKLGVEYYTFHGRENYSCVTFFLSLRGTNALHPPRTQYI